MCQNSNVQKDRLATETDEERKQGSGPRQLSGMQAGGNKVMQAGGNNRIARLGSPHLTILLSLTQAHSDLIYGHVRYLTVIPLKS